MSAFQGMEDLLQDFLTEASELLSGVDNKLVELERHPADRKLLNDIFRGFHTIKGGAGFLNVNELVALCHLTENLFDKLRNGELTLSAEMMDVILEATGTVRDMFGNLSQKTMPAAADSRLLAALEQALQGGAPVSAPKLAATTPAPAPAPTGQPDWNKLYLAVAGPSVTNAEVHVAEIKAVPAGEEANKRNPAEGRRATDQPDAEGMRAGRRDSDKIAVSAESTIRIDTGRLDQVLNLSGEIGLAKNRLNCLRTDLLHGKTDVETMRALDQAVSHLDLLVGDLQKRGNEDAHAAGRPPVPEISASSARPCPSAGQAGRARDLRRGNRARQDDDRGLERSAGAPGAQRRRPRHRDAGRAHRARQAGAKHIAPVRRADRRSHRDSDSRRWTRHAPGCAASQRRWKKA